MPYAIEWKATWDWAAALLGDDCNRFFRGVAEVIAAREGWEELGSSDVWHTSIGVVSRARQQGDIKTGAALRAFVLDYQGIGEWEIVS
jgi:hypothetical protein